MILQNNYIELLLKKIPKRIISLEERDITAIDENRTSISNGTQPDELKENNEWTQEYEVIYNSYILER
jgi:hypothetical protein